MNTELLEKVGLTHSEVKVYLALLELGSSTVGPITDKAKVASSKTYELLSKLMEKGLATTYKEGRTNYYKAVDPNRLKDYLQEREHTFKEQKKEIFELIPSLELRFKEHVADTEVEVFKGYKGVANVFREMIRTLNKGDDFLVSGGGDTPTANPHTKLFYEKIHRERSEKGIILRIIFSEARRKSLKKMALFPHTIPRYLPFGTPSTINIYKDTTLLIVMSPSPAAIRIKDKSITSSYRAYFEEMWKQAKK
ncbi:MAG: helix-turn-helix domain-containing protein [Nanoarchaeota archaeon]